MSDFQSFVTSDHKLLIVKIKNEALEVDSSLDGTDASIEAQLQSLRGALSDHVPAYVVIRNDNKTTFTFVSYVPSGAKVHDKMVYASTNRAIARDLGADHFSSSVFVDSKQDFTPQWWQALQSEKKSSSANRQAEQAEQDATLQADELWLQAGSTSRRKSLVQDQRKELGFKMDPSLEEVVYGCAAHPDNEQDVVYTVVIEGEELQLGSKHVVRSLETDLVGVLPAEDPSYNIVNSKKGQFFIYCCPSGSKVRDRMKYAANRLAFTKNLSNHGFHFKQAVEIGDPAELNVGSLLENADEEKKESAKASQPLGMGKLRFSKPRGPRRR